MALFDSALFDAPPVASIGTVPAASDVRFGVAVGSGTGTLAVPAVSTVLAGTTFDNGSAGTATRPPAAQVLAGNTYGTGGTELTGTATLPTAAQVLTGVAYGVGGIALTGNVTLPSVGNVRNAVTFGSLLGLTGTLVLPQVSDVRNGITYGGGGNEFTGTNTQSSGSGGGNSGVHPARLAVSSDQQQYDIGDLAELTAKFTSLSNPATPAIPATVRVEIETFDVTSNPHVAPVLIGSTTTYTATSDPAIQNPSDGVYILDLPLTGALQYRYKWIGTGAATAAEQGKFLVRRDFAPK